MRPGIFERKVGCNLDRQMWERLSRQTVLLGESRGCLLRMALEAYLDRLETDQRVAAAREGRMR